MDLDSPNLKKTQQNYRILYIMLLYGYFIVLCVPSMISLSMAKRRAEESHII